MQHLNLGRLESKDFRDLHFPMKAVLPTKPPVKHRYWNQSGWWGDQGLFPHCVAYAWLHWLEDGPVTHNKVVAPMLNPVEVYNEAQEVDEWEGTDYEGTSVRAGAKVLQRRGFIKEYRWGLRVEEIANAILTTGPVVVGTEWYYDMFEPNKEGYIKAKGVPCGGHAYLLNGVNTVRGEFRIKNNWGREWGKNGNAYITFEDFQRLMNEDGEACLAIENKTT